jgi:hypothetical protein
LIVTRRGGGTRVAYQPPGDAADTAALSRAAEDFVIRARAAGADRPAILSALERALDVVRHREVNSH